MKSEHLALIPLPKGITLQMVTVVNTHVVVQVGCQFPGAACPECQHLSRRVHSHYTRTVADLPCAGRRVVLHLRVRKFVCRTPTCPQQIFTERLVTFVEAYARMTNRLRAAVQVLGMLTGGQSGARLASHLGMRVSAPTLLRRMRQVVLPPPRPVRVVGIDDWAWRKGQTYGTILVDLEQHCPIDLLPDRTSATTQAWLGTRPEVQLVSRDRSVEYADAIRAGAPQAIQIADKFHLLKNLREALQQFLERKRSVLPTLPVDDRCQAIPATARRGSEALANAAAAPLRAKPFRKMSAQPRLHPDGQTAAQEYRRVRRDARYARYETVRTLVAQRVSHREIARRVGLSRETVTRFAQAEAFPELPSHAFHPRRSRLDPFKAYLHQRCQQGCWNGSQLYAEIHAQGFAGSLSLLRHYLTLVRKQQPRVTETSGHTARPHKASILDPYKPYLVHRCQQGCWNSKQLYDEIRTRGFGGSQPTVRNFLADLRQKQHLVGTAVALHWDAAQHSVVLPREVPAKPEVMRRISPARASWLVFLPVARLADDQRVQRDRVRGCHPDVEAACTLVSEFVQILTERRVEALDDWLTRLDQSHLAELQRFARGVRRDEAAVRASCASDVSNGQVEGQITRLKLLKRRMYGRANFDLLRLRVLYRA